MPDKSPTGRYEKQLQRQLDYEALLDKRWADMSPEERKQFPELEPGIDPTYLREVYGRQPVQPQTITGQKLMYTAPMMMETWGPQSRPGAPSPMGRVPDEDLKTGYSPPDAFGFSEFVDPLENTIPDYRHMDMFGYEVPGQARNNYTGSGYRDFLGNPELMDPGWSAYTGGVKHEYSGPQEEYKRKNQLGFTTGEIRTDIDPPIAFDRLPGESDYGQTKTLKPAKGKYSAAQVPEELRHSQGRTRQNYGDEYRFMPPQAMQLQETVEFPSTIEDLEAMAFRPASGESRYLDASPESVFYSERDPGETIRRWGGDAPKLPLGGAQEMYSFSTGNVIETPGTGLNRVGQALEMAWDSLTEAQIEQLKSAGGNEARADLMMDFYYGNLQNMSDQGVDVTPLMLKVDPRMGDITQEDLENRANYYYWKKFTEGDFPAARPMSQGSSRMIPM